MPRHRYSRAFEYLNKEQREAVELIANGVPYTKVAKKIGRQRATLYKWRNQPEFAIALSNMLGQRSDAVYGKVVSSLRDLLDELLHIAHNAERDTDRIAATKQVVVFWDLLKKSMEDELFNELASRVEILEEKVTGEIDD